MKTRTDYWRKYKALWLLKNREKQNEAQRRYRQRHSLAIKVGEALGVPIHEARRLTEGMR